MEKVYIDPKGDVCFVTTAKKSTEESAVTKEEIGYVVSSKVLRLASEVFAALLGPHFREGCELATAGPGDPVRIYLPDDNPGGMRILLEVLHHCSYPMELPLCDLSAVAKLVDKYRCGHAFRAVSGLWIPNLLRDQAMRSRLPEFLGIAVAFRNEEAFAAVSFGLAITTGKAWNKATTAERVKSTACADIVSSEVCREIDLYGQSLRELCSNELLELVRPLTRKPYESKSRNQGHHQHHQCRHDEVVVMSYFRHLQSYDILPYDSSPPVLAMSLRIGGLFEEMDTDQSTQLMDYPKSDAACTACTFMGKLEENLSDVFMEVIGKQSGACLPCLVPSQGDARHWCNRRPLIQGGFSECVNLLFSQSISDVSFEPRSEGSLLKLIDAIEYKRVKELRLDQSGESNDG